MTLEQYFRDEYAEGKIDFVLRVSCIGQIELYLHPMNRNGATTPPLVLEGNTVRLSPRCTAPGWSDQ